MRKLMAVVITGAMLAGAAAAQGQMRRGGVVNGTGARMTAVPAGTLDAAESAGLVFTREEEKLARDVYLALHETWQAAVFVQIAGAEQRHMDAVKGLLDRYGIADPVGANPVGVFTDPKLASLYVELVAKGRVSLADALAVGAAIEDLDIADIDKLAAATENADLDMVYGNLARGSRNHLRSFVAQLATAGGSYTPQYISAELYAQIITTAWERGGNRGQGGRGRHGQAGGGNGAGTCDGTGHGNGNGQGNGASNGTGVCDGTGQGNGNGSGSGRGNGGNGQGGGTGNGQGNGTCDGSGRP
jgi:hypothetical protein